MSERLPGPPDCPTHWTQEDHGPDIVGESIFWASLTIIGIAITVAVVMVLWATVFC